MQRDLQGKVALITGSSRGIGKACALKLASAGADIAINYVSHSDEAEEVRAEIEAQFDVKARCYQADISCVEQVQEMFSALLNEWSHLDILVNNAGIHRDNLLMRMKDKDWDDVISINLKGLFNCTKLASRQMLKQKQGRIVNVASVVGQIGNEGQANYATTKAGIMGFTKSLALELGPRQIAVNAVAPGYIDSEMTEQLPAAKRQEVLSKIPYGRFGQCEEVAEVVLFLSSEKCRYLTGQTINVDGGMVMK